MSSDPNTVVPENGLNDCTAQPPKDDAAAACSERPSLNGVARASSPSNFESVVSSEDGDPVSAVASSVAPTSTDETVPADVPDVSSENDVDVSSAATELQVDPVDVVPDLNVAGPTSSSDDVPENEINQEVVDLGTDPHFYEDSKKKVGYDRGLEPDHIVGVTRRMVN
ncbi:unnamed protein product [Aphis gossypii]|uniref:Uncharacterized protein n=1 Tax=Aphis gossypii TaxID=80765 RepID=A0A9P0NN44_APHGO|nr:unnamed protein product [Aphis gossypii]